MRTEVKYIADDGREFNNLEECEKYEKEDMAIMKTAKELLDYCISQSCSHCAFHNSDGCMLNVPCDWKLNESGD